MGKTVEKTVDELRPIDDVFFEKLSADREFCEEVLQVILQKKDLYVIKSDPQKSLRNIKGRSVVVDVLCVDSANHYYNIEIQKSNDDDHQRRVRYNGSNVDTYISEKGTKFADLPDLYVVYISCFDFFKKDQTIYHIDRVLRETGDIVDNGFHEIYVNAQIDDNSEIAELMQLFISSGSEGNARFPRVSRTIKHLKTGKGRDFMCRAVEEYAEIKAKEAAQAAAKAAAEAAANATARENAENFFKNDGTMELALKIFNTLSAEELQDIYNSVYSLV